MQIQLSVFCIIMTNIYIYIYNYICYKVISTREKKNVNNNTSL